MKSLQLFLVILYVQCALCEEAPTVKLSQGEISGISEVSRSGREYNAFYSIPFATAGRFESPKPVAKWTGVYNATKNEIECAQIFWWTKVHEGQEDCLMLSVYTPNLHGSYPVIVYFHGGGFTIGGAKFYTGGFFMDEDVVFVPVNYRLGALGFLSTQDEVFPGNNGLKDQHAALQWVQDNIRAFGGDPSRVTIAGNSAGGASVNYQILSPSSSGLFHAGIAQSGSSLCPWAISPKPLLMAKRFANAIGCPAKSTELLKCLQGKSLEEILTAQDNLTEWGYDPFTPFGPVVEPDLPGAFITEDPKVAMEAGRFNKVPLMTGIAKDEGILMHSAFILGIPKLREDLKANWKKILPITLEFNQVYTNFSDAELEEKAVEVKEFYFGNKDIGVEETRQELTDAFSDRYFNVGVREAAILQSKYTSVYLYMFAHNRGNLSMPAVFGIPGNWGVSHADELSFLYPNFLDIFPPFEKGSDSEKVSINLVKLFASFAQLHKPSDLWGQSRKWNPITPAEARGSQSLKYLRLDVNPRAIYEPFTSRIHFWERLLEGSTKPSAEKIEL